MTPFPPGLDALLRPFPPAVQRLALAARARILALVPHAEERVRPGWRLLGFAAPRYFAFVAPEADHVRVGFEHGVLLDDQAGLLAGDGTQVRHVRVRAAATLAQPAFAALVLETAALPSPRGSRRPPGRTR